MNWVTAGQIAFSAASAVWSYFSSAADDAARKRYRDDILLAIATLQDELLDTMIHLEVNALRGELQGFRLTYATYDADPNDPAEEERLRSLIDDSAQVLGRLGAGLDSMSSLPELALETWAVYVPLIYLRAQAMTERQLTFGASEITDILPSIDEAIPRLEGLLSYLRSTSDRRFSPIKCRPLSDSQDARVCWYRFLSGLIICGSLGNPQGIDNCTRKRARHMESAYSGFEGVRQITAAAEQLRETREAIESFKVLDLLRHNGVHVGPLVLERGRVQRGAMDRSGDASRDNSVEWFA